MMETNNKLLKIYPQKSILQMRELRYTYKEIEKKAKITLIRSVLLLLLIPVLLIQEDNPLIALVPLALAFILYQTELFSIKKRFEDFDEKRHYEFLYFFQLLVPHLKQAGSTRLGLFNVLQKMESRLEQEQEDGSEGILKSGVNRLLIDLTNRPGDITAFKDFAKECSGTEIAEDIAVALYDWQQNSTSEKQLDRLKDTINKALDHRVEEMMQRKLDRFSWYSTRVLFSVVVLSVGILGTTIFVQMMEIFGSLTQ